MKKYIIALSVVFSLAMSHANAQFDETNNLFYHTLRTPQSNLYNPAFFPNNNTFYLMLPGVDLQFGGPIPFKDVMYYDKNRQQTVINLDTIFQKLNDDNNIRLNAAVNLLGFGFKVNHTFITFNTRLVNNISIGFPASSINAILDGNMVGDQPLPEIEVLNGDILNATSYLETGIGVGHYFEPIHLTVGVRAKLLYGIMNVQTDNTRIIFNTDSNLTNVSARMYYEIQTATCLPYDTNKHQFVFNSISDLLKLGSANTGWAFDLGAKYDWGPFSFSLAINDLTAGIHWKSNVMTWTPENGQGNITFNGMDISSVLDHGTFNSDSLSQYFRDRINNMKPKQIDSGDYWFSIPTKINLGASYSFAKMLRAGLLFHGQFDRGLLSKSNATSLDLSGNVTNTFRWNTTVSLGVNLFNWAEFIVGSSLVYDGSKLDAFNPGVGVILTPFTVLQAYVMADYISSIYLTDSKAFNLKLGLNLLIGKGGRSVVYVD